MLLVGNGRVFTLDPEKPYLKDGAVVIDGEVIREVGLFGDMKKKYPDAPFSAEASRAMQNAILNTIKNGFKQITRTSD